MAIDLDGVSDHWSVPDDDSLSFGDASNDSPFTLMFWLFARDTGFEGLLDKRVNSSNIEYTIFFRADETFLIRLFDLTTGVFIQRVSATAISLNAWHHIAVTYDASETASGINWYIDGVLDNGAASSFGSYTAMHNTAASLDIATIEGGADTLDGILDDFRIYSKEVSSAEIATIYASRGTDGIVDGLVSRWLINEDAVGIPVSGAGSIKDIANTGNDANPISTPLYGTGEQRFRRKVS